VQAAIDWPLRHARMRMHTALHLLSAVLPYPVTGGSIGGVRPLWWTASGGSFDRLPGVAILILSWA
jgi:hypothetical protein